MINRPGRAPRCETFGHVIDPESIPPAAPEPDLVELLLRGIALLLYNPAPEAKAWVAEVEEALKGNT